MKQPVIASDETMLKVVESEKANIYMWLYARSADSSACNLSGTKTPNIVLYDHHNSRDGQCAVAIIDGYKGYLKVDGYQGYKQAQTTLISCWVHVRRKFLEAKKNAGNKGSDRAGWVT